MDIQSYLHKNFEDIGESGDNWQIDCPFCDDRRKRCGIHKDSGKWYCFNCESAGRSIHSFEKKLTGTSRQDNEIPESDEVRKDRKEKKVLVKIPQDLASKHISKLNSSSRNAMFYLEKCRGFKPETIAHFQLGSWKTNGYEYVSIPFWKRGKLVNIKYRAIDYKDRKFKWRRIKGGESSLFHDNVLDHDYDHVFVTEAELDAVALWNAGFRNVVAVTTGAKSFQQEWYDRLERFKKIYLVYDNDVDGQAGAEKAANRLGLDRCLNVVLPKFQDEKKTDANNFFWDEKNKKARLKPEDFAKLVKDARKFEVKDIVSLGDALKDAFKIRFTADEDEIIGFPTGYPRLDKILKKGVRPGHLVVVSGNPKTGKTTWVQNWLRYQGKQGTKSLIYECEMKPEQLSEKYVAMETRDIDLKDDFEEIDFSWASYALPTDKIWIGHPKSEALTLEGVCATIRAAVQRYGIRIVVFDNLHFLVRSDNVKDEIGRVTRTFKLLAESLNVLFILIVHPRKIGKKEPTPDDLKDSSSIFQDLDTLIFLHRANIVQRDNKGKESVEGNNGYEPITKIIVTGRWSPGGWLYHYFDGARSLFMENTKKLTELLDKRKAEDVRDAKERAKKEDRGHRRFKKRD